MQERGAADRLAAAEAGHHLLGDVGGGHQIVDVLQVGAANAKQRLAQCLFETLRLFLGSADGRHYVLQLGEILAVTSSRPRTNAAALSTIRVFA